MSRAHHRRRLRGVIPFVVAALLLLLVLLSYTVLTASPKDMKLGIVSLDEGVQTSQGDSNLGAQMVEKLASGEIFTTSSDDLHLNSYSIELKTYKTQDDLNNALQNDEVTGAIVIPEDYTKHKLDETTRYLTDSANDATDTVADAVTGGVAEASQAVVDVIVRNATDPVTQQHVGSSITRLLNTAGLATDSEYPGSRTSGTLGTQSIDPLCHLWLLLPPAIVSILLAAIYPIRKGSTFAERAKRLAALLASWAILSAVVAIADLAALSNAYRYAAELLPSIIQLWTMSFLAMAFFGGLAQIRCWLAALVAGALLLAGALANWAAPEGLPLFALPWVAETFTNVSLGDVAAGIPGLAIWDSGIQALVGYAVVGIVLAVAVTAFARPRHTDDYE